MFPYYARVFIYGMGVIWVGILLIFLILNIILTLSDNFCF